MGSIRARSLLRASDVPMALVHDEYGHFEGLLTPADILDAIAGAFRSDEDQSEPEAVRRDDGSWLLAGWMPVDEMADLLGVNLPETRHYETVAGFVIDRLERIPQTGEAIEFENWRLKSLISITAASTSFWRPAYSLGRRGGGTGSTWQLG